MCSYIHSPVMQYIQVKDIILMFDCCEREGSIFKLGSGSKIVILHVIMGTEKS